MKLIITDFNNWEKSILLDKAVFRVGASTNNDIQLDSPNIAPTHLQFNYLPEKFGCKVLNLGSDLTIKQGAYQDVLQSYASAIFQNGEEILLGDYRIRLELPLITKTIQNSKAIHASLEFPDTTLYPHTPTVGWLTVQNSGEESPSQFHLSVSGLPADCVKIDPIPLLYSGAQEKVRIQLFHRGQYPHAGLTELSIRVFAPGDYPGEQVLIEQGIYVTPIFEQELIFDEDAPLMEETSAAPSANTPDPDLGLSPSTTSSASDVVPPPPPEEEIPAPTWTVETPSAIVAPEIKDEYASKELPVKEKIEAPLEPVIEKEEKTTSPKPVVIRDLPEEFWDEDE